MEKIQNIAIKPPVYSGGISLEIVEEAIMGDVECNEFFVAENC